MTLKDRITDDMKSAMKARDSARLGTIRLLLAAVKQKEVDERITLDDAAVTAVIDKMLKQRRDAISQYEAAGRADLAAAEQAECAILSDYMPQALSPEALEAAVRQAIADSGASGPADMGKVMAILKPALAGRADMGAVSGLVKRSLTA